MKAIHTLILWILLLALPMQAFAAVSMVTCPHITAAATHCPSEAEADTGATDCSIHFECRLAAALAPSIADAAANHPLRSQQIAYLGAYASSYCPDRLERPPLAA